MSDSIDVTRAIKLTELLARCQEIKRAITLPHGESETDSHHAFSLALIAMDICKRYKLDVDVDKVVVYALVHDLLEIITGDEPTLMLDDAGLAAKYERERLAEQEFKELLHDYPDILETYDSYERLDTVEAATVFVLDKTCTIWNHFHNDGDTLFENGVKSKSDIDMWYERTRNKIIKRLKKEPPEAVNKLFEDSFQKMRKEIVREEVDADADI